MTGIGAIAINWCRILDSLPGVFICLDREDTIKWISGKGLARFERWPERAVGMILEIYLSSFSCFRIQRGVDGKIAEIDIGDKDWPCSAIEMEVLETIELSCGTTCLVLADLTDQRTVNRFMDLFHDLIESDLIRRSDEICASLEHLTRTLVVSLESANLYNDPETGNHILRVSNYSALLAELLGYDEEYIRRIRQYSSLHDIGKVGIPDIILKKPGLLTQEERNAMMQHVLIGGRLLDHAEIDPMAKNIARYHHEKWDGSGYSDGISGEAIPVEARIVAVADVYDSLRTFRVYKEAFPRNQAVDVIKAGSGSQFDPSIARVFLENEARFDALVF